MRQLYKSFLREFSGFLSLAIAMIVLSLFTKDVRGAWKWFWTFRYFLFPAIILGILSAYWPRIKGALGERRTSSLLSRLDPDKYKTLNNVLLRLDDGRTSQIDHVVVSVYGIFVIEVKNYTGWIYGSQYEQHWTQVIYKRKEPLFNPIRQNYGHTKALEEVLKDYGELVFWPVVVFSDEAVLKVTSTVPVINASDLIHVIKDHNQQVMTSDMVDQIYTMLETAAIRDRREVKRHVESVKDKKARSRTARTR
jgi:hypothetical protein